MAINSPNFRFIFLLLFFVCSLFFACKKDNPAPLPTADFFVNNNGCVAPCFVYFYDQSQNAVSWKWDFGNLFTSTAKDDSITYNLTGFYNVTQWAYNVDGVADSITKTVQVY